MSHFSASPGPHTYRVIHGGRLVGYLSSLPGLFESAHGSLESGPPSCSYKSLCTQVEPAILELLYASLDLDTVLTILRRAGLELESAAPGATDIMRQSAVVHRTIVPSTIEDMEEAA